MNTEKEYVLEMKDITKHYGENTVLNGVSLSVKKGEIHALLGENGAGKSTLMNILFGMPVIHSTGGFEGKVLLDGEETHIYSPYDAMEKGIGMVHQEFMLLPGFTITENIKLNREITNPNPVSRLFGKNLESLDMKAMAFDARKALDDVGMNLDEKTLVHGMPVGYMQFIEIAREIDKTGVKLLVFDEPTAVLTESEAAQLISVMKKISESGIAIIFITHRLDEVFEISTDVGIMRDGRITLMGKIEEFTKAALVKGLLPDATDQQEIVNKNTVDYSKDPVLELKNYSGYGFKDISLKVYPGEILGVAGVVDAGRTEMAQTIFGMDKVLGGKVYLDGNDITGLSTQKVMKAGVNYVSEDRHADGIFKISSVAYNITSGVLSESFMGKVFLNQKKEKSLTQQYIDDFRIKVTGQEQEVGSLSGGNQQKVVIGHALATNPKLIILDEPTDGLHLDDIRRLMKLFNRMTDQGNTLFIIEHSLDVMKDADYIVELGPGGGLAGGSLLFAGTPKEMLEAERSVTREYLRESL